MTLALPRPCCLRSAFGDSGRRLPCSRSATKPAILLPRVFGPLDRSDAIQDRVRFLLSSSAKSLAAAGGRVERSFEVGGNLGGGLPRVCRLPTPVGLGGIDRAFTGGMHLLRLGEAQDPLRVDLRPRAAGRTRREPLQEVGVVELGALGINPAEARRASSSASSWVMLFTPLPFLAIFIHTPRALSWFASSHFRHADAVVNARSSSRGVMVPRWPITETVPPAYACSRALLDVRRDRPTRRSVDEIVRTVIGSHGGHLRGSRPPTVLVGSRGKRGLRERRALRARSGRRGPLSR